MSYQEDAEYFEHRQQLVNAEFERRRDTGFVTDTSKYPWIEEGEPVSTTTYSRFENIRAIQDYCADVAEREEYVDDSQWTEEDGAHVASLLNKDPIPGTSSGTWTRRPARATSAIERGTDVSGSTSCVRCATQSARACSRT